LWTEWDYDSIETGEETSEEENRQQTEAGGTRSRNNVTWCFSYERAHVMDLQIIMIEWWTNALRGLFLSIKWRVLAESHMTSQDLPVATTGRTPK
jgi:hypothetical protein